ncbi:MAG: hypothetical protein GY797_39045 [Deltaproteobacteria bacterium]|nr:hypothetical protein [Deltaproteobacteria bacterium]
MEKENVTQKLMLLRKLENSFYNISYEFENLSLSNRINDPETKRLLKKICSSSKKMHKYVSKLRKRTVCLDSNLDINKIASIFNDLTLQGEASDCEKLRNLIVSSCQDLLKP